MAPATRLDALISVLESREQAQGQVLRLALADEASARADEATLRDWLARERPQQDEAGEWRSSEQRAERLRRELRLKHERTEVALKVAAAERATLAAMHQNLETVRRAAGRLQKAAIVLEGKKEAREQDEASLRKFQIAS